MPDDTVSNESRQASHQEQPGLGPAEKAHSLAVTSRGVENKALSKRHGCAHTRCDSEPINTLGLPWSKCRQKHQANGLAAEDPAAIVFICSVRIYGKLGGEHKLNAEGAHYRILEVGD